MRQTEAVDWDSRSEGAPRAPNPLAKILTSPAPFLVHAAFLLKLRGEALQRGVMSWWPSSFALCPRNPRRKWWCVSMHVCMLFHNRNERVVPGSVCDSQAASGRRVPLESASPAKCYKLVFLWKLKWLAEYVWQNEAVKPLRCWGGHWEIRLLGTWKRTLIRTELSAAESTLDLRVFLSYMLVFLIWGGIWKWQPQIACEVVQSVLSPLFGGMHRPGFLALRRDWRVGAGRAYCLGYLCSTCTVRW